MSGKYVVVFIEKPENNKSLRTVSISNKRGIKASIELIRDKIIIVSYLFLKSKGWKFEEAKKWTDEHKNSASLDFRSQLGIFKQVYMYNKKGQ